MRKIAILLIFVLAFLAVNITFAAEPQMSVYVADIQEGSTAHVSISLPSDATGKVTVSVNGQTYTAAVEGGQAYVNISGLKAGDYTVKVTYEGSGNYPKIVKQVNLTVSAESKSNGTAPTNTSANASGEPTGQVNITDLSNLINNNTNSSNSTNGSNSSNVTPKHHNDTPVQKPKQPKKPLNSIINKNTGLPIVVLMLVAVGAIFATVYRRN